MFWVNQKKFKFYIYIRELQAHLKPAKNMIYLVKWIRHNVGQPVHSSRTLNRQMTVLVERLFLQVLEKCWHWDTTGF